MLLKVKNYFAENPSWLSLSLLLFLAGFFLAFYTLQKVPDAFGYFNSQIKSLTELGDEVFSSSPAAGIYLLLSNNMIASFSVLLFSFFLGLPPLIGLIGNGSLLGVVAFILSEQGIKIIPFFIFGVLPHGIFELPAFFISASLGLKIGYHIIFPYPGCGRLETLKQLWQEIVRMVPAIFLLLLIAAAVEVLLTPYIIQWFLPTVSGL